MIPEQIKYILLFLLAFFVYSGSAQYLEQQKSNTPEKLPSPISAASEEHRDILALEYSPVLSDSVIAYAHQYLNRRYQSGGNGPDRFDCSGFTNFVFSRFGYNLERSSGGQVVNGRELQKNEPLQKGDLVFFKGRNSRANRIGHVGLVTSVNADGTFNFIHATVGAGVIVDRSDAAYYKSRYVTASRVLPHTINQKDSIMSLPQKEITEKRPFEKKDSIEIKQKSTHLVKKGETLYAISKQYGVSVEQLKMWNNKTDNNIQAGQHLLIEKQDNKIITSTVKTHIVKKGETLFSISRQYGCSVAELRKWNQLSNDNLQIKQKLIIR